MPPSQPPDEPQWPPRSPHDALLSTPGGRARMRHAADRTSPSPSPFGTRRIMNSSTAADAIRDDADDEEDEDEETLQLKLQMIQARLKLKKLQKEKDKGTNVSAAEPSLAPAPPRPKSALKKPAPQTLPEEPRHPRPETLVPASPVKRVQQPPTRGSPIPMPFIDKDLKAKFVSLKGPRSPRKPHENKPAASGITKYLQTSRSQSDASHCSSEAARPRSFNERLAAARGEEEERRERHERIARSRTDAFGISKTEMEQYKASAVSIPDEGPRPPPEFSRDDVLAGQLPVPPPPRVASVQPARKSVSKSNSENQPPGDDKDGDASFESYSSFHLSKRIVPHATLARQLRGKAIFNLKDLLKKVKSPNYELPDIEEDIVVFGIVASKSEPRAHKPKPGTQANDRTKYMVLTIVDLKWELELFLFNSGFTRFWKIPEGTVVAILNPSVMPPPQAKIHSGKFSLVVNSDADTIIEVGRARDLGFCKSVKRDGNPCNSWVNSRRTEFCEFHSNEAVRKTRASRAELNQMGFGGEFSGGGGGSDYYKEKSLRQGGTRRPVGSAYDRETHSHWFVHKSASAADLLDGVADRKEREEAIKRRLAVKEKETAMMKALGKLGTGTGQEYMRSRTESRAGFPTPGSSFSGLSSQESAVDGTQQKAPLTVRDLGLVGSRGAGRTINLSPVKRKRADSSQSQRSTGSGAGAPVGAGSSIAGGATSRSQSALGWGGGLQGKLSRMKGGEKLVPGARPPGSPVKKKTRFMTEKGIREAGRESLGDDLNKKKTAPPPDDSDDDLIII